MVFIELGIPAWKDDFTRQADVRSAWAADQEFVFHEGSNLPFPARFGQATKRSELKSLLPAGAMIVIRFKQQQNLATVKL